MATAPQFAATIAIGLAQVSTANTGRDGTGTIVDGLTAGASGSLIDEIVVKAEADPADCTVTIFIHNGSTWEIYDEFDIGNPAAASTTVESYRASRTYENFRIPTGYKTGAAITVAPTSGLVNVWFVGGHL